MSESCNSRHFSWLVKSCFPQQQQRQQLNLHNPCPTSTAFLHPQTTISSLPEDLILECLSRVPHYSLPSISLVCRRWSHLLHSSAFYHLRRRRGHLHLTVFAVFVSDSGVHSSIHRLGHDDSWNTTSFLADDAVSAARCTFSHARLAAIDRKIFLIGRDAMIRCDTWTGTVTEAPAMLVPRNKFAASVVAGKIYVAGGAARAATVEEYDPETNTWRVVASAPRKRYGCIGASLDGVFYVIGGLKIGASGYGTSRAEANVYASSMDLYDVEAYGWLRSRVVPGGGCVVAACAAGGYVYVLASHAVELSFWRFNGCRSGGAFGEWCRMKSPPLPAQARVDSRVRFNCVGVGDQVVFIQVMGCIDDLLRRNGRSTRGLKEGLVLVYHSHTGEWCRGVHLPEGVRRAACVCVEC
ncbi:hypothetical protein RJ639_020661 [Escallonia herrerae]|uniref:F-box domain-containing protein n=1 Tax=Escallonia herrerae TaxID=1293975 RepID=A0AA88V426_9ASTE|nr:hypothetical protein RJ639_020661 [Escallonia herrerae]